MQIDEPILGLELDAAWQQAFFTAYQALAAQPCKLLLTTYFASVAEQLPLLKDLPIAGLHIDVVRAPAQLDVFTQQWPAERVLSVGIIDGRNVWRADLCKNSPNSNPPPANLVEQLWLSSSCSLLHTPVDLAFETELDSELKKLARICNTKTQ